MVVQLFFKKAFFELDAWLRVRLRGYIAGWVFERLD